MTMGYAKYATMDRCKPGTIFFGAVVSAGNAGNQSTSL
jgi:hypothetical protein